MDTRRALSLSGVVFVVLAVVAVVGVGGDTPSNDASAAKVFSFYDAHHIRQALAAFVFAASVPFLIFFGVSLASALWGAGAERPQVWPHVLIGGSILAGGALLIGAYVHFALADGADQKISAETLQGLNVLDADTWMLWNSGLGVMMLGAAGCLLAAARGPRWLGWAALILGVVDFVPFADFPGLVLTLVWIVVVSVLLYRGSFAARPAVEAASH